MLWAWEPVKCWSRLPNSCGGTIRRSTETPLWVCALTPFFPGLPAAAISGWPARCSAQLLALVGGRDQVDVLAGLGPAADRARHLDPVGARVLAQRLGQLLGDRPHGREQQAPRPLPRLADPLERGEHVFLGLRAEAFDVAEPLVFGRLFQLLEVRDLQFVPEQARGFRADPGDPRHLDQGRREFRLQLQRRRDLAGLEQGVDLFRQRLADAGDLGGTARAGELLDRDWAFADRLAGGRVGEDAVANRPVELVQHPQFLQGGGDLGVGHRLKLTGRSNPSLSSL